MITMEKQNAIEIKGLNKYYKKFQALKNLNLEVKEGEFLGFLGPNGAGKTTAISIITGLTNYNQGSVKIFGNDVVKDYREARKLIGLVPQEFNFDHFFTTREILVFNAGYFGIRKKDAEVRADYLLKEFKLYDKKDNIVKQLSGGQKRRLLIARALMHKPKILILDEPTAGVDVELRRNLWNFMEDINKKGTTILLTTHYIEEAEKLANRIAIINNGEIIELDDKKSLMDRLNRKTVNIKLRKPIKNVPKILQKVKAKLINDDLIRVVCDSNCDVGNLIDLFHECKIQIKDMEIEKSKLEDIFIEVTGLNNKKGGRGFYG